MLITPVPLPSELDLGYFGAVMRLNGIVDSMRIVQLIEQSVGMVGKSKRDIASQELLSKISQTEFHTFVAKHTMLPFQQGITSYHPDIQNCCQVNRNNSLPSGKRTARKGAYFCKNCVRRDQQTYGTSYWHREHQLPGLYWCPEHRIPLCYAKDQNAFLNSPADILDTSHSTVSYRYVKTIIDNQYIHSFLTISLSLLNRDKPFNFKHVSALLKMRASELGFRIPSGNKKKPKISGAVIDSFGRNWLSRVLPELTQQSGIVRTDSLDGLMYSSSHPYKISAYVLALATLFESPESALSALTQSDAVH